MVVSLLTAMTDEGGIEPSERLRFSGDDGLELRQGVPRCSPPVGHLPEGTSAQIPKLNAKRKPDKSKICRIKADEYRNVSITCSFCNHEFGSYEEVTEHETKCNEQRGKISPRQVEDLNNKLIEDNNNESGRNSSVSPLLRSNSGSYESNREVGEDRMIESNENDVRNQNDDTHITQQLAQSNIALEAIQNTRLALIHLASNALKSGNSANPRDLQEMAMLQNTLYTLQHQQVMQLQLIRQLQDQISVKNGENRETEVKSTSEQQPFHENNSINSANSFINRLFGKYQPAEDDTDPKPSSVTNNHSPSDNAFDKPLSPGIMPPNEESSVINPEDSPLSEAPSTLEMLQKTANDVLHNASQGLLTNRLIDDSHRPIEGKDCYKHRCRYCGKIFGSDSALQIHVRSHTGERPFKCNICGNRFTTKGNLKVHFQRHSDRFPNVPMNPHPIPEHLDKLHPPLLAQLGELSDFPSPPTGLPNPYADSSGTQFPLFKLGASNEEKKLDLVESLKANEENFSKCVSSINDFSVFRDPPSNEHTEDELSIETNGRSFMRDNLEKLKSMLDNSRDINANRHISNEDIENDSDQRRELAEDTQIRSLESNNSLNDDPKVYPSDGQCSTSNTVSSHLPEMYHSQRQLTSNESAERNNETGSPKYFNDKSADIKEELDTTPDYPEDLTSKSPLSYEQNNLDKDDDIPDSRDSSSPATELRVRPEFNQLSYPNLSLPRPPFPFMSVMPPRLIPPAFVNREELSPSMDPSKYPAIYSQLLPRPGSTDSSWESLIEIDKSNETAKLESFVNNIEHKITDPNQCFICNRVLSCKSALQMHYRTHTGERPFKCRICGRSFTTKGNLKTHMGVHRAKPPMRMFHQCPVCHKKFTNVLILQQHIRLHTGEPTDLTPEQISAGELHDFMSSFPLSSNLPPLLPGGFPIRPTGFPRFPIFPMQFPLPSSPDVSKHYDNNPEELKDEDGTKCRNLNDSLSSSSSNGGDQRNAEDLTVRFRDESRHGSTSPRTSTSPTFSDYSDLDSRNIDGSGIQKSLIDGLRSTNPMHALLQESLKNQQKLPLDLTPKPTSPFHPFSLMPPLPPSKKISTTKPIPPLHALYVPKYSVASPGQGNTTCQVCFKIFACQSALEIHYRSHTKERPFQCPICERRFSTKGNMKQHLQTHKQKDLNQEDIGNPSKVKCLHHHDGDTPMKDSISLNNVEVSIKRERETESNLPESKRYVVSMDDSADNLGRSPAVHREDMNSNREMSPTMTQSGSPALRSSFDGSPQARTTFSRSPPLRTTFSGPLRTSYGDSPPMSTTFSGSLTIPTSLPLPASLPNPTNLQESTSPRSEITFGSRTGSPLSLVSRVDPISLNSGVNPLAIGSRPFPFGSIPINSTPSVQHS